MKSSKLATVVLAFLLSLGGPALARSGKAKRSAKQAKPVPALVSKGKGKLRPKKVARVKRAARSQAEQLRRKKGKSRPLPFAARTGKRKIRFVLFDLDGTIANTQKALHATTKDAFKEMGIHLTDAQVAPLVDGAPLEQTYGAIVKDHSKAEFARFVDAFDRAGQRHADKTVLYPGAKELLVSLANRPGVKIGLATARDLKTAEAILKNLGIRDLFSTVHGTGGTDVPPKPAPNMLFNAARDVGVSTKESLMVGDTTSDIVAGRKSGMATVALTHGFGAVGGLRKASPDHLLSGIAPVFARLGLKAPANDNR